MDIRCERIGAIVVCIPSGRLDSAGAGELENSLSAFLVEEDHAVVLDMAGVSYLSSAGIRVLSAKDRSMKRKGGAFCLCSVRPYVSKVLGIAGFDRVFSLCGSREEGISLCRVITCRDKALGGRDGGFLVGNTPLITVPLSAAPAILKVIGSMERCGAPDAGADDLVCRKFIPDEYSAGIGALGESAEESFPAVGDLATLGGAIFMRPAGGGTPDFLLPKAGTGDIALYTAWSVALDGPLHECITAAASGGEGIAIENLFRGIFSDSDRRGAPSPGIMAAVIAGEIAGLRGSRLATGEAEEPGTEEGCRFRRVSGGEDPLHQGSTLLAFGICIDRDADLSGFDPGALSSIIGQPAENHSDTGLFVYLAGLVFPGQQYRPGEDIAGNIRQIVSGSTCLDFLLLHPATRLFRLSAGISWISELVQEDAVPVRILGQAPAWNPTYEGIARRLNPGCREIELVPLTGGFSGTLVFRVNAWDRKGRKMMPLVMKLGPWPVIRAEIRGYTDHVRRYIQNNATHIIQQDQAGKYGGILYNFVGIRGAESRIQSLEDFYCTHDAGEILPVLDTLFRVVLKGWYGQPRLKDLALYREYGTFWEYDRIREYAANRFGALPDSRTIELPFGIGQSANPIWFVEEVLPGRLDRLSTVYEASVHCDLNMRNVLMDEERNLWLIDFSETRSSHILRDIAKLEVVLKGEMTSIRDRDALSELVRQDRRYLSAKTLSDIPGLPADVSCPDIAKAFTCVQRLRRYADLVTLLDDDFSQYLIALFPYTLSMLAYTSADDLSKEYAWISSSIICNRLL